MNRGSKRQRLHHSALVLNEAAGHTKTFYHSSLALTGKPPVNSRLRIQPAPAITLTVPIFAGQPGPGQQAKHLQRQGPLQIQDLVGDCRSRI